MKTYKLPLVAISFLIFILSCDLSTDNVTWEPSIIGPIIYTEANVKDISDLEDKSISYLISPVDIGYPEGTTVDVPPFHVERLGPQQFTLSEYFLDVEIDSAIFTITITNVFPIVLGGGTKIVLRTSADTFQSSVIFEYELGNDILPGENFSSPVILEDRLLTSKVYMYIEDFQSPGANTVIFPSEPSVFGITISFLSINKIRINTSKSIDVKQTMDIEFTDNDPDSNFQQGILYIKFTNELPVNINYQIYFLNQSQQFLDSVFSDRVNLNAAVTDLNSGDLISTVEKKLEIPLDDERLDRWESSESLQVIIKVNTIGLAGSYVTASKGLSVKMKASGDMDFNFTLN